MSMNLHVEAIRSFEDGEEAIEKFDLWQTPTKVTYHCLEKEPRDRYKEWVISHKREAERIGDDEWIHYANEHLDQLDNWIDAHKNWSIEWYYL